METGEGALALLRSTRVGHVRGYLVDLHTEGGQASYNRIRES